jgi:hypothetical protein
MTLIDHGWSEMKRRWQRFGYRRQLAAHERERASRLAELGQRAMQQAIDLSAYAEWRDRVEKVTAEIAGQAAGAKGLEAELAELRSRRQTAEAELDARRQTLHAEQAALKARSATPDPAESSRLSSALAAIAAERSRVLDPIDTQITRVSTQLRDVDTSVKAGEKERQTRLTELGQVLYDRKHPDPALAEPIAAMAAEDERRALTRAALHASQAESASMPPHAFRNFVVAALAVAAIVIGVPAAGYSWWSARQSGLAAADPQPIGDGASSPQAASRPQGAPSVNPLVQHEFASLPAYVLANRLSDAKTAEEAQTILLEVFHAIGLGVYRGDGTRVLAGGERSEKDFFLYDFQWRILARTQIAPSSLDFETFATVLGTEALPLKIPQVMVDLLGSAIHKRYVRALTSPQDPNNFIVLFIDGLARRQPEPYSLSDMQFNGKGRLPISPVQSVLLVMDFFMKPSRPPETASLKPPSLWRNAFTVHAAGPCDLITSESGRSYFGNGLTVLGEAAEESFGMAYLKLGTEALRRQIENGAILFDQFTGIVSLIGDLLILYGIEVKVEPQPYTIHLIHDEPFVAGIKATVTFDPGIVPEEIINCGWLVGKSMPAKGPLKDVETSWRFSRPLPPYLEMHRESDITSFGSEGLKNTTNEDGVSMFLIRPNYCADKTGRIVGEDYMAIVSARKLTLWNWGPTPTMMTGDHGRPQRLRALPRRMAQEGSR